MTLPTRPVRFKLIEGGTIYPSWVPPPLLNNNGQQGELNLPLRLPPEPGSSTVGPIDDFTSSASSWTLVAHEARPGHELQFDSMLEHGVSIARWHYTSNPVNAEGWALYAEHIVKPFMPLDGQLVSLQYCLLRAARAFIDVELQAGTLSPEDGLGILTRDVALSDAFAAAELAAYAQNPGRSPSYFYGYRKWLDLRKEVPEPPHLGRA